MSARVGLASIDGAYIDQHFGSARYWQIWDIGEEGASFVEARKTKPGCQGHCDGDFQEQLEVLKDCDALFVARIGQGAALAMLKAGKRVFEAAGAVEEIVEAVRDQLDAFAADS